MSTTTRPLVAAAISTDGDEDDDDVMLGAGMSTMTVLFCCDEVDFAFITVSELTFLLPTTDVRTYNTPSGDVDSDSTDGDDDDDDDDDGSGGTIDGGITMGVSITLI